MCKWQEKKIVTDILIGTLIVFIVSCAIVLGGALIHETQMPNDDSDPESGRSGLSIYRDSLTGCEYVVAGLWPSSATPRLKADGSQVCRD